MSDSITAFALPGLLADIARATSIDIAVAIARTHGGRRLSLPTEARLKRDHGLCKLIGVHAARIICRRWGGARYEMPSAKTFLHWYDARRLRAQRASYSEISRALGIGYGRVQELLRGFPLPEGPAPAQSEASRRCGACGRKHRTAGSAQRCDARQLTLL